MAEPLWHELTVEDAVRRLETDANDGLSPEEAGRRIGSFGHNEIFHAPQVSAWTLFLSQFRNVMIVILLLAAGLSAFLGEAVEAVAIAIIVVFAAMLGFVQEFRAEKALDALGRLAAPSAIVIRGGRERDVPARELVPGDVVRLSAGDRVPADARLLETFGLRVDESSLTGESVPVDKQAAAISGDSLPLGDRTNMALAGTSVSHGRGRALVVTTGMQTEFGRIAGFMQTVEKGRTPLQKNLDRVGHTLARVALAIVTTVAGVGILRGQPPLDILLFAIALAVAVVPEALPAVVTISLAIGVQRMAKRNALVRRLPAVETLGSVSVICSDKTGTLTRDEMTVRRVLAAGRWLDVTGAGYSPEGGFEAAGRPAQVTPALRALLEAGTLASDARVLEADGSKERWEVHGDPTEAALVVAAAKAGLSREALLAAKPRVAEFPFSSEAKRMTTLHEAGDGLIALSKGAPEVILDSCQRIQASEGTTALDAADREEILESARRMAGEALRVLAVAWKPGASTDDAETDMVFLGLVGLMDPPREEARTAVRSCASAGIRPLMITGDHPVTAAAVASEIGLLNGGTVVTGGDLDALSDEDLESRVPEIAVFARVSPAHKLRVVSALQSRGHLVAMTGDGVNDAPALRKADIGIAMGLTGTDVTRESADMTLTDDNFASIVAAVEEGRGIFENIKKYLMFLLSSNLGEVLLLATSALIGWPLPLTPVQILYVNLATDGLPALALAVDPHDEDLMSRPPRNPRRGIFSRPVVTLMAVGGFWSGLVNLSLFNWALAAGRSEAYARTMVLGGLVLIELLKAYNYRSDRRSVFRKPFANRWLNLAVLWELGLLLAVIYMPVLSGALGTARVSSEDWLRLLLVAGSIVPVLEIAKWLGRRGWYGPLD